MSLLRPLIRVFSSFSVCPSCSKPLSASIPACTVCWNISPLPKHTIHHDLFALPYQPNPFRIDTTLLKQRFRQAQSVCHPDAWATRDPLKQHLAHSLSSRINEAYQTLLRPLPRAEYILEQHGIHISERDQVDEMHFMAEIMDARELIDDAQPQDKDQVQELIDQNNRNIDEVVSEISGLVEREDWTEVKPAAIRLRYLEGITKAAERWLDSNT